MRVSSAKILFVSSDPSLARRWAAWLRACAAAMWDSPAFMPPDEAADVILFDRPSAVAEMTPRHPAACWIWIGSADDAPADVAPDACLPPDATEREVQLACRLAAEVARLRRRAQHSAALHRQLAHEAATDPLTRLANRRGWDDALQQMLSAAAATARAVCVALVDLDHFKRINDAHGHAAGDAVLAATADALRSNLRSTDFAARLGGDEFGLLFAEIDEAGARRVVERVRAGVYASLRAAEAHAITASAGYVVCDPRSPPSAADAYARAADALRAAKAAGRDRTVAGEALRAT